MVMQTCRGVLESCLSVYVSRILWECYGVGLTSSPHAIPGTSINLACNGCIVDTVQ